MATFWSFGSFLATFWHSSEHFSNILRAQPGKAYRIFYLRFGTVQLKDLANQIMSPEPTFSSAKKNGTGDSGEFLLTHAHKSDLPVQLEAP